VAFLYFPTTATARTEEQDDDFLSLAKFDLHDGETPYLMISLDTA
jgi:hypothetical protein